MSTAASARPALVFWREMHRLGDERTARVPAGAAPLPRRGAHARPRRPGERRRSPRVACADTVTFTIFGVVNELPLWYRPPGRKRPAQLAAELADLVLAAW